LHIKIRRRPTDDGPLPKGYESCCPEPLLFAEVEIIDFKLDKKQEVIRKRLILDELLDLTGFYPLDDEHLTSRSFSFEKDLESAFRRALGDDWQKVLLDLEKKLGVQFNMLENALRCFAGDSTLIQIFDHQREVIVALLNIIESASFRK